MQDKELGAQEYGVLEVGCRLLGLTTSQCRFRRVQRLVFRCCYRICGSRHTIFAVVAGGAKECCLKAYLSIPCTLR